MKASKILRFANLVLAGTLTGNEFGTLAAVHPALEELGPPERIRAEQEVTRRFGQVHALLDGLDRRILRSGGAVLARVDGVRAHASGSGMLCGDARSPPGWATSRSTTACVELDPEKDQQEFAELRKRWDRLHALRVALNLAGLVFLVSGALAEDRLMTAGGEEFGGTKCFETDGRVAWRR